MFKGPYGVLLTPFTEDGKVDYNAFESELDFLLQSDIQGFFACGTTGEFVSLSPEENIELMKFTAKRLAGKKQLLAGASDPDADVWVELKLSADPAQADQQVRGNVMLPHGNGRTPRVLVLTKIPSKVQEARLAGADYAGGEELCEKITDSNWLDFDAVVASPEIMGIIGRMSPVLSPRGLMPSPKAGTLTPAVGDAVRKLKSGQLSYRMDNRGSIRCIIGKVSFGSGKLAENMDTLIRSVVKAKPAAVNGQFIRSCTVSSNTGPGIEVSTAKYL